MARELGIARTTVKQYLRGGDAALVQVRPEARALDAAQRERAGALFDEVAKGNAVVVHRARGRGGERAHGAAGSRRPAARGARRCGGDGAWGSRAS